MRFLCCGEALIDLLPDVRATDERVTSTAGHWLAQSAGSPLNTAAALTQAGYPTGLLTRLGNDVWARQLADDVVRRGIDPAFVVRSKEATPVAVLALDASGRADYRFYFQDTAAFSWRPADLPAPQADTWLHLGSIAWVIEPGAAVLRQWLEQTISGWAGVSYDINVRPAVLPNSEHYWQQVEPLLRLVGATGGVIKASDDDVAFLAVGHISDSNGPDRWRSSLVKSVANDWAVRFGATVVITLGAQGALAVTPDGQQWRQSAAAVTVVDTIGAGDAFMAGFLGSYVVRRPGDISTALRDGSESAGVACQRLGAAG
jgi:fructokinase